MKIRIQLKFHYPFSCHRINSILVSRHTYLISLNAIYNRNYAIHKFCNTQKYKNIYLATYLTDNRSSGNLFISNRSLIQKPPM